MLIACEAFRALGHFGNKYSRDSYNVSKQIHFFSFLKLYGGTFTYSARSKDSTFLEILISAVKSTFSHSKYIKELL